ncbi:MAG TPA: hypothetical protein VLS45_02270, partial [Methylomicrobium sp.]|nr:hypothetical protein [Methylomicrobium sp.]
MIEKSPGCSLIEKLRAILLMEADFNANNKEVIGINIMDQIRKHNLMPEEIFSEVGKTAEDGGLAKVLFYDIVRQCRLAAAISSIDAANCYDSIAHAIASLIFQACGVPVEGVEAMLTAIQEMRYFLRTAFGDSKHYRGSKIEVKYQGLCQGNGAAPAGWAAISITILGAHKKKGHSATLICPVSKREVKLAAILYVDDCDLLHINMSEIDSTYETYEKMQDSVMNWGRLLIATGGSYKPEKCFYHLISFRWLPSGKWAYENNHEMAEYEMRVPMPDGTTAKIDHLPVTTDKKTLGIWTSPVGSSAGAMTAMREKAQEWVDKAKEGHLKRSDIWFLLDCQFWPRVGYGLGCNMAEHSELENCLSKQYFQILPLGGVIRTVPRPARQLGKGFFGIGCPHPGIECFIQQISKLLMHYGCSSSNGSKLRISFRYLVVELGRTVQPFLLSYKTHSPSVTRSWLVSLWEKSEIYEVKIVIDDSGIELPRERDRWLMEEFDRMGWNKSDQVRLNRVRCHQQVLFLSEVLSASGCSLDDRYLRPREADEEWSTL